MLLRLHHYYCYSCSLSILHSLLSQIDSTAPVLERKKCGASNSVTRGITDWRDDKNGTSYPPKGSVYMTVSRTANSNKELNLMYLKKIIFPAFGIIEKEAENFHQRSGIMCDDFKGHSSELVKDFTLDPSRRENLKFDIMKGERTPVGQPLGKVLNKVFNGYLLDLYDIQSLTAPVNPRTGHLFPPSRQLLATWIVQAWVNITEYLCRKAWNACG